MKRKVNYIFQETAHITINKLKTKYLTFKSNEINLNKNKYNKSFLQLSLR